ncbi:mannonate dehydratase [Algirhabdus cladophorae]|uniref:mannonate dehydratase n=1 Tax=Algirhabdus cladophorae TaxID=3377108 RepID=UPI003B849CF1
MQQTWRWFGPHDPVSVADMIQCGVQGVVTALHDYAPGEVWPLEAIEKRQEILSPLPWSVVESLPVSEAIKTQGSDMAAHIEAYKTSLRNLAAAGLKTVCYNFMPVLDWTRTELKAPMPHGGHAMRFDLVRMAAFDLFILGRAGAAEDFDAATIEAAKTCFAQMSDGEKSTLQQTVTMGLPGANDGWSLEEVRSLLATYDGIDETKLKQHLTDFLAEVVPVAAEVGINMCAHPDDPPFSLLGLPRILSSQMDYAQMCAAVDLPQNGVTMCTGSLGVSPDFDPTSFVAQLGPRIHFVHLRNTSRTLPQGAGKTSFFEDAHLDGDTDMVATLGALVAEEARRGGPKTLPFRPDHGQAILQDLTVESLPGYPLLGRMRGLAELRGVIAALEAK